MAIYHSVEHKASEPLVNVSKHDGEGVITMPLTIAQMYLGPEYRVNRVVPQDIPEHPFAEMAQAHIADIAAENITPLPNKPKKTGIRESIRNLIANNSFIF